MPIPLYSIIWKCHFLLSSFPKLKNSYWSCVHGSMKTVVVLAIVVSWPTATWQWWLCSDERTTQLWGDHGGVVSLTRGDATFACPWLPRRPAPLWLDHVGDEAEDLCVQLHKCEAVAPDRDCDWNVVALVHIYLHCGLVALHWGFSVALF